MPRFSLDNKVVTARISFSAGSGPQGQYRHIQLVDEESGLVIAQIEMSHQDFGQALALNCGKPNCIAKVYLNDNIGKTLKVKEEVVTVEWESYSKDENRIELIEAVKPFEVDGWIADLYINRRRHNHKTKEYPVVFRRYVEKGV